MQKKILVWLGKYNISTHTLVIATLALSGAYEGYPPFHALVSNLPNWVQVLIGTGGFIFALYKKGALPNTPKFSDVKPADPPAVVGENE